ncbi:hypothetical protein BU14_2823s0002, partial [Porphyra umbilicalis]
SHPLPPPAARLPTIVDGAVVAAQLRTPPLLHCPASDIPWLDTPPPLDLSSYCRHCAGITRVEDYCPHHRSSCVGSTFRTNKGEILIAACAPSTVAACAPSTGATSVP